MAIFCRYQGIPRHEEEGIVCGAYPEKPACAYKLEHVKIDYVCGEMQFQIPEGEDHHECSNFIPVQGLLTMLTEAGLVEDS